MATILQRAIDKRCLLNIAYFVVHFVDPLKESLMEEIVVYSVKVNREHLVHAKKFLARQGELLQDSLRDLIEVAADCEQCLELQEEEASITELQSAFTTLLANCKDAWYLNRLLQDAVMRIAKKSKVPLEFVANVLSEARRTKSMAPRA